MVNNSILNVVIPCNYIWSQMMPLLLSNTTFTTLIRLICNNNIINHRSLREKCGLILANGVPSAMVHICIIQNKVHCSGNNINICSLREVWDSHILCNRISSLVNISILNIVIPCNYIWSQTMPLLLSNTTFTTLIRLICNNIINYRYLREKCGLIL